MQQLFLQRSSRYIGSLQQAGFCPIEKVKSKVNPKLQFSSCADDNSLLILITYSTLKQGMPKDVLQSSPTQHFP